MADEKFQVIVIGAGLAGSAAAYQLAKAGREVLLVDRGKGPGAKNMTGGRIYTYALKKLLADEWQEAPLEREVTREMLMMMTPQTSVAIDSTFSSVNQQSYTVLRSKLDAWLAAKAEEAGAMMIPASTVDAFLMRDGKVCGVKIGDEELEADLVISAEGVNSLVAERAGVIKPVELKNIALGIKHIVQLPEAVINERFNTVSDVGTAMLCVGECTKGISGGAFLYTNKNSISLGMVVDSLSWKNAKLPIADIAEALKHHPAISRYIEGGEVIEYSAHLIPEGGISALPQLFADGVMIAGDAAGLVVNSGFTVRGMDYAILSGIAAAETANEAIDAGDYSRNMLKGYETRLQQSVLKDMHTFKNAHDYMAHTRQVFTTYPMLAADLMSNIYGVDGTPAKRVLGIARQTVADKISYFDVLKDMVKGARSL